MCYIIAEAGLNHNGSLSLAKEMITLAKNAGADAVKFQKRDLDSFFRQASDSSHMQWAIREKLEFTKEQILELYIYAKRVGVDFICTAFDIPSAAAIHDNVDAIKIPSHRVTDVNLLKYVSKLAKPVIISSGMCTLEELDKAMDTLMFEVTDLTLLHCVSAYPTPARECNLSLIPFLRGRYGAAVGYSGHEWGFQPTLAAVTLGATVVERHFTMDKNMEGFDHYLSLDPSQLRNMVAGIRNIPVLLGDGKKRITDREMVTRDKYVRGRGDG